MCSNVERLWPGVLLGPTHRDGGGFEVASDSRRGVIHIAEHEGFHRADHHAGWEQPVVDAVRAEVTFRDRVLARIDVDGVVRTGLHARFTSDTAIVVDVHNPVGALEHRRHGANMHTRRIGAVVATHHGKVAAHGGKFSDLDSLYPRAVHAERNIVF